MEPDGEVSIDFHYSRTSNEIYVTYFMYLRFFFVLVYKVNIQNVRVQGPCSTTILKKCSRFCFPDVYKVRK